MNSYSVLTPIITVVLFVSTGLVFVDEAIEHGSTTPEISERYWDYEMRFIDEESLDNYTGKWSGEGYPNARVVEHEDGASTYCGNFTTSLFISENNVKGSSVFTWDHLPDQGVVKLEYEMEGRINDNGVVNGTFELSYQLSMLLNDPTTIIDLFTDGWTLRSDYVTNFSGAFNADDAVVSGSEETVCSYYVSLLKEEIPSSDSIIQNIPGVDPYVGLLIGGPFESESNPDEEAGETITQVGTIIGVAGVRQISKLRSKPRSGKEPVDSKEIKSTAKNDLPASEESPLSDILPEEKEVKGLSDDSIPEFGKENDELFDEETKPEEKTWFDDAGKQFRKTVNTVGDFLVNLIPGTGSVGAGGALEAGKNLKEGADFAKKRSEYFDEENQSDDSDLETKEMNYDSLGNVRRFGIDKLTKMAGSKASMSATLGGVGAVVGTAIGGPFGGIVGGVIGGVVGGFIG